MKNTFKRISREEVYKGKRVHLFNETLLSPEGKEVVWENIYHLGAAAVVPVDEEGNIILVRQYRLSANAEVLEIPAGVFDSADEDPAVCASRELEEETGFRSDNLTYLFKFFPSIGLCTEMIYVYLAKDLQMSQQNLDEDEFVSIEKYSIDTLMTMIAEGEIVDSKTISALLYYKMHCCS